jgi:hypothetical protein
MQSFHDKRTPIPCRHLGINSGVMRYSACSPEQGRVIALPEGRGLHHDDERQAA